ncbi:MAG: flagellar filament capping protein FliD [Selenomonadaceae bacterium]|nr:flagellar filament capping protein FliD [Selenomonadaceae bacterium]
MGVGGIYGLSGSGLDIDSMVKVGMMSKQNQLDKMQQTYTKNEWKKEALLDIYKKVEDFNLNKMTDYKLSSNLSSRTATSSDSAITAKANADSSIGPHSITVTSTASNAYIVAKNNSLENSLEGVSTTVSLANKGDKALSYLGYSNGLEFTINNNTTITADSDTTLYGLVSKVNAETSKTGVKMTYDSDNGYISFFQQNLGTQYTINIAATDNSDTSTDTASFFNELGLQYRGIVMTEETAGSTFSKGNYTLGETITGTDATAIIDDKKYTADKNSISADGVTYNIGNVTSDKLNQQIVVNVDQDPEKIIETVKSFVKDYNELIDSLYDAYREAPNSSYKPLTDAQKNAMTADQITKWEEKAKAGMLYHDQTLRKVIDDVRNAVTLPIDGVSDSDSNSIYKLGISTTGMYGQITLNEDKLREALSKDSDAVYKVFSKPNTTATTDSANGIAVRLSTALTNATTSISKVSGRSSSTGGDSTLDTLLRSMQERISNFKKTMSTFENNLYKRYDAMESALASLGSQMSYLSSMFAS